MVSIVRRRALAAVFVLLVLAPMPGVARPVGAEPEQIRIVRDQFGVPHVFADTARGASYGVGYALAQDRLWQMHVFRHIAKGELSDIFGPSVVEIDKTVRFFTYTQQERADRFATYPADIRRNLQAFVDGINAWIAKVRTDASKLPLEFTKYGEALEDWTVDDSLALQDVLILAFGSGGGEELAHAGLLSDLVGRYGETEGRRMFDDLVMTVDADAPVTIPRRYEYRTKPVYARIAEAEARRALEDDARLGLGATAPRRSATQGAASAGTLEQLALVPDADAALKEFRSVRRGLGQLHVMFRFGSNAQIVGPRIGETGNTLQTGGPQVGYLLPQWLADFGMHGGRVDATGMTFAGAGPAVLIGRGEGYAWTTTTGASDLMDTYVEELNPDDSRQYRFNGSYEEMACRTEVYTFKGVPFDEQEICRTRHGPVASFDEANDVAYSLRYAWFNREGQTVEGFFRYGEVARVGDFGTFANYLSSNHNMFYTDDAGNFGYWHPGNHVVRAPGIDMRLPQDGTGASEWRGLMPIPRVPHAVNFGRGWLANWNNQPAAGWRRERGHPPLDNVIDLQDALNPRGTVLEDPFGGRVNPDGKPDFQDMSANLRYAAFKHHTDTYFRPFLPRSRWFGSDVNKQALAVVRSWDGFLTDNNHDGAYDSAGNTILDRWVDVMHRMTFNDDLGGLSSWASGGLLWHVLARDDRQALAVDWEDDHTTRELRARAFRRAVRQLSEEFDGSNPETWRQKAQLEHYQRINADLFEDIAEGESGDNSDDSGRPGDVRDHIAMDRGTYNHIVAYLEPPTGLPLGDHAARVGSVIPPGQSGFITPTGQESPHYEDQLELYEQWRYKPMPMTLRQALRLKESEETITRTP
jgi:penicillin amidase